MKKLLQGATALLLLASLDLQFETLQAQGTAFTYQGRLNTGTNLASGSYDLRFALFDTFTPGTGAQQGNALTNSATAVSNGLFTVALDFGNQFPGAPRWLEIGARSNGVGTFTTLLPRQALTPTPYAVYAGFANATNLVGKVQTASLSGVALLAGGNALTGTQTVTSGSVGLGTTTPANTLDVQGSADVSGTVGIGTLTPKHKLDVNGNIFLGTAFNGQVFTELGDTLYLGSSRKYVSSTLGAPVNGSTDWINLMCHPLSEGFLFGNAGPSDADPHSAPNPLMVIRSNGNVGIGAVNPTTALQVNGTVSASTFSGNGGGLTNLSAANVSGVALLASKNTFAQDQTVQGQIIAGGPVGAVTLLDRFHPVNGFGWQWVSDATGLNATRFNGAGGAEYLTITTNGAVGIGTANPTTEKLVVSGGVDISAPANPVSDSGLGLSFESFGGRIQSYQNRPLILNPIGNRVGIGLTNPAVTLDVNGSGHFNGNGVFNGSGVFNSGQFNGSVGIGTSAPSSPLTVAALQYGLEHNSGGVRLGTYIYPLDPAGVAAQFGTISAHNFGLYVNNGEPILTLNTNGNVGIGTTAPQNALDVNGEINCVALNITSDRNAKEGFKVISPRDVLNKVAALPITEWQYKPGKGKGAAALRHIGPMAQDFSAAFGLSQDEKHISVVDEGGVALAAIQGLNEKLEEKDTELRRLKSENQSLAQRLAAIERVMGLGQDATPLNK